MGEYSQRSDSNRQPLVYKTRALPLSYVGVYTNDSKNPVCGQLSESKVVGQIGRHGRTQSYFSL